jgi:hypothetical protein
VPHEQLLDGGDLIFGVATHDSPRQEQDSEDGPRVLLSAYL